MADALIAAVQRGGPDAEASLTSLKIAVAKGEIPNQDVCRKVLEAACALAVARKDKAALERNLAQLRPYGLSQEMYALQLLLLLVESRLSDFFALLELVDRSLPAKHIDFVVGLERDLTEGSYHKALRARKDSTSPLFGWLLEELDHTVRDELASCIEMSHRSLKLQNAKDLLNFESLDAARKFCDSRHDWVLTNDTISFPSKNQVKTLSKDSIPSDWTVRECLNMALELDRIV